MLVVLFGILEEGLFFEALQEVSFEVGYEQYVYFAPFVEVSHSV